MNIRLSATMFVGAALLFATGCQTVQVRINQKPEVFARLDTATQAKIRRGIIEHGYTEDMVYLALGKPAKQHALTSKSGSYTRWIYHQRVVGDGPGEVVREWRGTPQKAYPPVDQPRAADGSSTFISEPRAALPAANLSDQPERNDYQVTASISTFMLEIIFKDGKVHAAPSFGVTAKAAPESSAPSAL